MSDFVIENGILTKYTGNGGDVVIPDGVTEIGRRAFYECSKLTSVSIPDSVTSIGYSAFAECTSLTSVTIPKSVKSIEEDAFGYCTSLTSITIPNNTIYIGTGIFGGAFDGCEGLTDLFVRGYHIHGNFGETDYYFTRKIVAILFMLESQDFSVKLESKIKYPLVLQHYVKTKGKLALIYIKRQFSKIVTYAIKQNNIEAIEALTEVDNLFTKKNIDKLIQTAIDNQRHEIYVMLLNYKAEKLGFKDIANQFKL